MLCNGMCSDSKKEGGGGIPSPPKKYFFAGGFNGTKEIFINLTSLKVSHIFGSFTNLLFFLNKRDFFSTI